MPGSIAGLSARQIAAQVNAGDASAVELCDAALAQIEAINPGLNALVNVEREVAREDARAIDARIRGGEHLPLAGVPIVVKDNLWVRDRRITQGSRLYADFIAPRDAYCVERARAAGAVIAGISACPEFACKGITDSPLWGATRHPWNPALTPGGSSGGAVAAVASGMVPLAIGTDAGGSTRRPAAHCGLVGMKPSSGLIAHPWGFTEPNFGFSVIGTIARDVEDCALLFGAMIGHHPQDPLSVPMAIDPLENLDRPPSRTLRIGVSLDLGCGFAIDADVADTISAAIAVLHRDRWRIDDAVPAWPSGTGEYPLLGLQQAGLAALYGEAAARDPGVFDPAILEQIEIGKQHTGPTIAALLLMRDRLHTALAGFFERCDLLLCPTAPVTAWPIEQAAPTAIGNKPATARGHAAFTPLFNYCGVPACSVPVGLVRGLPVGLQIVGRRFEDALVLRFARVVERTVGNLPLPATRLTA
jgi:aspartyl-tRNA(Asn)/glutamyl-tRNA(Gln) amidotransferase subunit A